MSASSAGLLALDREEHQADRGHDREAGDREHPGRTLLCNFGAAQLHLLLQPLLLERGLRALTLGRFGRLDAHTRFALGGNASFLDRALVIALLADLRFLLFADATLGLLLCAEPCVFRAANRVLFLLHAALLDLTELAEREQH